MSSRPSGRDADRDVAQDNAAMAFWALQTLYNYNHNQAP
jgi:hypothetical protein